MGARRNHDINQMHGSLECAAAEDKAVRGMFRCFNKILRFSSDMNEELGHCILRTQRL